MVSDPYRPRRVYRRWWWPAWLRNTALVLAGVLGGLTLAPLAAPQIIEPRVETVVEYRNWPVYIDQMPLECYKMLTVANDLRNSVAGALAAAKRVDRQILKAIPSPDPDKMIAANKAVDGLAKYQKQITTADDKFQDQFVRCSDS